ncbi:MAG: isoprenyl transferase [Flavobacteriales bacterium]|nr:isoprenyl transferase [Flavobacteriales bacterium]
MYKDEIDTDKLPQHVAITMDGNGRWAKSKGKFRVFGHQSGVKAVRDTVEGAAEIGLKYITLYAFSTENWNRTAHEVASLMKLFRGYMQSKFLQLVENNVKVIFLGDPNPIRKVIVDQMQKLEQATEKNDGLTLNIALNYGGRDEILRAVQKFGMDASTGKANPKDLTVESFEKYLDTKGQKNPDLIIRTAGQQRLSNFLLWQIAYSELYFTKTTWPDFSVEELSQILVEFDQRGRTFGGNTLRYSRI